MKDNANVNVTSVREKGRITDPDPIMAILKETFRKDIPENQALIELKTGVPKHIGTMTSGWLRSNRIDMILVKTGIIHAGSGVNNYKRKLLRDGTKMR